MYLFFTAGFFLSMGVYFNYNKRFLATGGLALAYSIYAMKHDDKAELKRIEEMDHTERWKGD